MEPTVTTTSIESAAEWLVTGQPNLVSIHQQWADYGMAALLTGRGWDMVELSGFGADSGRALADLDVAGPVVHAPDVEALYVLVPPGTAAWWVPLPGIRVFGKGHQARCLLLPALSRTSPPGTYWITPPDGSGHLTDPMLLRQALADSDAGGIR
jgi:hypothetical protein